MSIRTTVVGSYPKVTDGKEDNLPGVIDRWQRKALPESALEEEIQKVIRRVIREQEECGIDLITDGQIRWEDLVHPIARSAKGISRGTLKRFFDNNVYYRKLELNGEIRWVKGTLSEEFQFAKSNAKKPVKVALPGPLTLVYSTELKENLSHEKLLSLYMDLLRKEVEALVASGAKEIQLDEPAFHAGEPLLEKAVEAVNRIFEGIKAKRWIALYFHDISTILPTLAKLHVEVLSADLVTSPKAIDGLKQGVWKGELALGLIDARNTRLESASDLKRTVGEIVKAIPLDRLWLSPNCGLEFLPHSSALKKLQLMREVAQSV